MYCNVEGAYERVTPCYPACLFSSLRIVDLPFRKLCFQVYLYLLFPLATPLLCWPILGWLSVLDGCLRSCIYYPLSFLFLSCAIVKKSHSLWLAGLVTLREAILLCFGAFCICICPCSLISALYFDPDGEESPTVQTILCMIDGRRFYYLHWWPLMFERTYPIGHPQWAWLGRPLDREYQYIDRPRKYEMDKCLPYYEFVGLASCCFDEIKTVPEFPWHFEDPLEHWESERADLLDTQTDAAHYV